MLATSMLTSKSQVLTSIQSKQKALMGESRPGAYADAQDPAFEGRDSKHSIAHQRTEALASKLSKPKQQKRLKAKDGQDHQPNEEEIIQMYNYRSGKKPFGSNARGSRKPKLKVLKNTGGKGQELLELTGGKRPLGSVKAKKSEQVNMMYFGASKLSVVATTGSAQRKQDLMYCPPPVEAPTDINGKTKPQKRAGGLRQQQRRYDLTRPTGET